MEVALHRYTGDEKEEELARQRHQGKVSHTQAEHGRHAYIHSYEIGQCETYIDQLLPDRNEQCGTDAFQVIFYFAAPCQGINEMWQIYVNDAWKTLGPVWVAAIQHSTGLVQLGEYGNLLNVTIMLHIDIYVYRQIQHDDVYAYEPIWRRCQVPVVRRLDDRSFYWLDYCCTQKGFHKLVYAETLLRCISSIAQLDFRYLLAHLNDLGFASLQIKDITLTGSRRPRTLGMVLQIRRPAKTVQSISGII